MSAALVVGFVSWLLLHHLIFKTPKNYENEEVASKDELIVEKPPGLTPEEKMEIQKELDRRKAEKEKKEREERVAKNVSAIEQALDAKRWAVAESHKDLLLDDSYSHEAMAKYINAIEAGKSKERADLLAVQELLDAAEKLDVGRYSPEAIDLLDKALLIYPNHSPSEMLREKINAYPYSLRVPEDVATLNEAAEMLRAGDTAILGKGVHQLPALLNKGIKIKGQGEKLTFVECDTTVTSAFTFAGNEQFYTISDLTVRGTNYEDDAAERYSLIMLDANLTMRNVTVKDGSGHGVAVMSGSLNMAKCKLTGNAWDGVSVMGTKSYAEITDCDVSGNFDHGVDFWKGARGKLTNVTANKNSGTGILIMGMGTKVSLIQVKAERNSQCGIVVNSQAEAEFERVVASSNQLSGIVVQGGGTKLTFNVTESKKNGEAGFFIDPAASVENFGTTTSEGNRGGNVIRKATVLPKVPAPVGDKEKT